MWRGDEECENENLWVGHLFWVLVHCCAFGQKGMKCWENSSQVKEVILLVTFFV